MTNYLTSGKSYSKPLFLSSPPFNISSEGKTPPRFCVRFSSIYRTTLLPSAESASGGAKGRRGKRRLASGVAVAARVGAGRLSGGAGSGGAAAVPPRRAATVSQVRAFGPALCWEAGVLFSTALVSAASWTLASGCAVAGRSLRY